MAALGVWAVAIGLADLVAPIDRAAKDAWRVAAATVALLATALFVGLGVGFSVVGLLLLMVVTLASGTPWLWLWHSGREKWALSALAAGFLVLVLAGDGWTARSGWLGGVLDHSPVLAGDVPAVVLGGGLALMLVATANRIVRIVLNQVGQGLLPVGNQLQGGRVIGPLERLLIFGLGLSGQLIAAGLVVTAKSLLRFSELRHRRGDDGDIYPAAPPSPANARPGEPGGVVHSPRPELMSEYLLVGSLVSWSLAFVAIGVATFALAA